MGRPTRRGSWRTARSLALVAFVALATAPALAQADGPSPGLYEALSVATGELVGPLGDAAAAALGRRLRATTAEGGVDVAVEPGGPTWELRYGPHGLVSKRVLVSGRPWTETTLLRDDARHLVEKLVVGPGVGGAQRWEYRTDSAGRPVERRLLGAPAPAGSGAPVDRVTWTWGPRETVVRSHAGADVVRIDVLDDAGRTLSTTVGLPADGPDALRLVYVRARSGALRRVDRVLPGSRRRPARPDQRDRRSGRRTWPRSPRPSSATRRCCCSGPRSRRRRPPRT